MAKAPKLPEAPEGWGWIDMAHQGHFTASDDGTVVLSVPGPVWMPLPMTPETVQAALADVTHKVDTPEGRIKLTGAVAIGAQVYKQKFESKRGDLRNKAVKALAQGTELDPDYVRNEVLTWQYGAKSQPTVSREEIAREAGLDPKKDAEKIEGLARYLASRGSIVV